MIIQRVGEDDDVVDVHKSCLPFVASEDQIQGSLETSWRVGQTKRHTCILEGPCVAYECRFRSIFLAYSHLPVPGLRIQSCEVLCVSQGVYTFIHSRQWIILLHGHSVRVAVINTKPQLSILLSCEQEGRTIMTWWIR